MRAIPYFDYSRVYLDDQQDIDRAIRDVCKRGAFILQKEVEQFEAQFASWIGSEHVVGVANGTDALTLALTAAGIGVGNEVIVPSHTFIASVGAIRSVGATPVLVDCGDDHLIAVGQLVDAITSRTRAIMPVHLNGRTADMSPILELARENDLLVIEDAAQGIGSRYEGRHAGTFGIASGFSFYPAKTLGCLGDGGAIATSNADLADVVRSLRDHGRASDGTAARWGVNSRLDNIQAAVLLIKLAELRAAVETRRALARRYCDGLSDVASVVLPPCPDDVGKNYDSFQNFEIEADRRDELRAFLAERGIGTLLPWGGVAVHHTGLVTSFAPLPVTERVFSRVVMLPMNTFLGDEDVDRIVASIREFYGDV